MNPLCISKKNVYAGFLLLMVICFSALPTTVQAFKINGHNTIEGYAYTQLLNNDPPLEGLGITGLQLLNYLIEEGFLRPPERSGQFRGLPYLGSGGADLVFSRQFGSNGQCFHFMAQTDDTFSEENDQGVPKNYANAAYTRCVKLLTKLTQKILNYREEAERDFQNVYAMIHIIGDSYSASHAKRIGHKIVHLKPWRLTTTLPYIYKQTYKWDWGVWSHYFSDNHHYTFKEERDEAFVLEEFRGKDQEFPQELFFDEDKYFTDNAKNAIEAVRSYLEALYRMAKMEKGIYSLENKDSDEGKIWGKFLTTYFSNADPAITTPSAALENPEWSPTLNLGFRLRTNENKNGEFSGVGEWYWGTLKFLPFQLGSSLEWQEQDQAGREYLSYDAIMIRIPLSEHVALGIRPYSVHVLEDNRMSSTSVHLDLYAWDRLWLQWQSPRFFHKREKGFNYDIINDGSSVVLGMGFQPGMADQTPPRDNVELLDWQESRFKERKHEFKGGIELFFSGNPLRGRSGYGLEVDLSQTHWGKREDWRFAVGFGISNDTTDGDTEDYGQPTKMDYWLSVGNFVVKDWVYLGVVPYLALARGNGGQMGDPEEKIEQAALEGKLLVFEKMVISVQAPVISYNDNDEIHFNEYSFRLGVVW